MLVHAERPIEQIVQCAWGKELTGAPYEQIQCSEAAVWIYVSWQPDTDIMSYWPRCAEHHKTFLKALARRKDPTVGLFYRKLMYFTPHVFRAWLVGRHLRDQLAPPEAMPEINHSGRV
jgi:hypothetical protein